MAKASGIIRPKWQLYDIQNNPEHELFEDYIVEFNDITGVEIDYYIRDESHNMDRLYGEVTNTRYFGPYRTKGIYEMIGKEGITNGFGIYSEEIIQYLSIPSLTITRDVSASYAPKPGDVLTTIWNNRSWEIVDVNKEESIFQLSRPIYSIALKTYRFSEQSQSARDVSKEIDTTLTTPISAFGDNEWLEDQSDDIEDYTDVDTNIYGF